MSSPAMDALERDAQLAGELAAVAARVRRSTVEITTRGRGGSGAGVVWRDDGLIVTNAHVIGGERVVVTSGDGTARDAAVVARDVSRDLAALMVDAADLSPAVVRDASTLRVGELVFAAGSPLGIRGAVSAGIVHAPSARGPNGRRWVRADLRLAPGNSGGPLADASGRVVGINSMIASGLAMAIPSDTVRRFVAGTARPALGVTARPVVVPLRGAPVLALLVLEIRPGSAAAECGLRIGDALIAADGHAFVSPGDLLGALDDAEPAATIQLSLVRGGRRMTLDVRLHDEGRQVEAA